MTDRQGSPASRQWQGERMEGVPLKKKTGSSLQSYPPTGNSQSDFFIRILSREVKQQPFA